MRTSHDVEGLDARVGQLQSQQHPGDSAHHHLPSQLINQFIDKALDTNIYSLALDHTLTLGRTCSFISGTVMRLTLRRSLRVNMMVKAPLRMCWQYVCACALVRA